MEAIRICPLPPWTVVSRHSFVTMTIQVRLEFRIKLFCGLSLLQFWKRNLARRWTRQQEVEGWVCPHKSGILPPRTRVRVAGFISTDCFVKFLRSEWRHMAFKRDQHACRLRGRDINILGELSFPPCIRERGEDVSKVCFLQFRYRSDLAYMAKHRGSPKP